MNETSQNSISEIDYTKPHAFELEVGRITLVCKCGLPRGVEIHCLHPPESIMDASPYGKLYNECLLKASPDMPLFVLKPTDLLARRVIEYWYMLASGQGAPLEKLDDALAVRKAFFEWQQRHPDRVHNPD